MWQEWLERTLTRQAAAAGDTATAEPCLFDVTPALLPRPANANEPPPPTPKRRADAAEPAEA
jgi:hypothetical protein